MLPLTNEAVSSASVTKAKKNKKTTGKIKARLQRGDVIKERIS
jgi:hypothetical protein